MSLRTYPYPHQITLTSYTDLVKRMAYALGLSVVQLQQQATDSVYDIVQLDTSSTLASPMSSIMPLLRRHIWMATLDLQDAYFHITIHPFHHQYLRFVVGHRHFQYTALPFGLSSTPRVFTKNMIVVAAFLRLQGMSIYPYIDDLLLGKCVMVLTDNTTALSYINRQGGTVSQRLCNLAIQLWKLCIDNDIFLVATHIPGHMNVQADHLSRVRLSLHDWGMNLKYLLLLFHKWGTPRVDVFANRSNRKSYDYKWRKFCSFLELVRTPVCGTAQKIDDENKAAYLYDMMVFDCVLKIRDLEYCCVVSNWFALWKQIENLFEKLYNSSGRELRRALFSLKQIFQDDKDLVHEFVVAEGLTCLIKVGAEADQNYQNYILRALGQIMLYVDGMNGVINHNETIQWLYTLIGSKFRLVVKTALKLLLVFVEYTESNAPLFIRAVSVVDEKRGLKPWSNVMEILEEKDGVDTELLVYAMTLVNKTLAALPDQDSFYDVVDCLEELGIEAVSQRHLNKKGADLDLVEQFNIYEMTLRHEDGDDNGEPPPSCRKDRRRASLGCPERRGLERRRSRRHSVQTVKSTLSAPASPCTQGSPPFARGHGQGVDELSEKGFEPETPPDLQSEEEAGSAFEDELTASSP
ncbi:PREDICTED: uncharacterized protein LOC107120714, partial [Gekko japonicus]|uniref:ribonuclease H n=1 Tax=Gekko japonicus TaxID=146911 RepID=A0ABM1KZ32_GEKJA